MAIRMSCPLMERSTEAAQTSAYIIKGEDMNTGAAFRETVGLAQTSREVRNQEWRDMLIDAAGGDSMDAALESARLLAVDIASTPDAIYIAIQAFYGLDRQQTETVMTKLAEEMTQTPDAHAA